MTKYIKIFAAVVSVAILGGCAHHESAKVSASVDQDFVNVYDAFEMAKTPRAKVTSSDTVSMSEGVWLGDNLCWLNIKMICHHNTKQMQV